MNIFPLWFHNMKLFENKHLSTYTEYIISDNGSKYRIQE